MNSLHCPNPTCTHTFNAAEVMKAGAVTCPKCGQEFRFRPPSAPPKPPMKGPIPVGKPAGVPPRAITTGGTPTRVVPAKPAAGNPHQPWVMPTLPNQPAPPATNPMPPGVMPALPPGTGVGQVPPGKYPQGQGYPPLASPVILAQPAGLPTHANDKIVRVRGLTATRSSNPVLKGLIVITIICLFVGGAIIAIKHFEDSLIFPKDPVPPGSSNLIFHARNQRGGDEKILTLNLDKNVWTADKDIKTKLKSTIAFKRIDSEADAWFAVAVQDFGFRKAREGELLNTAMDRLRSQFGDTLQLDVKLEPSKILGQDALRFPFKGSVNNVVWWGECYLIAYHGFGYWVYIAAPTVEEAQQQKSDLEAQNTLALTTERAGWREQPPEMDTYTSRSGAFFVQVPTNVWSKFDPLTADENGEIYLAGLFQGLQGVPVNGNLSKNATLLAITLDKKTDLREAFKDVRVYFEKKKQEEATDYKFIAIEDKFPAAGELVNIGDQPGCIGELKLLRGSETMRYMILGVFNDDGKTHGLRFECAWENRAVWRKEFQDLLKTVKLGKK